MKPKQKMQDVSFTGIDTFLAYLPDDELKTAALLRKIIFRCIAAITEKISYQFLFYRHHTNPCFT